MAATSLAVQPGACPSDSIFSLLDSSWYAQSILNYPTASSSPSVERPGAFTVIESKKVTEVDEAEMRRVFDRFDRNGDGLICGEELRRYMSCCGNDLSDAEANSILSCVDLNEDGGVDFEEFLSLYRSHCSADADGNDHKREREDEEEALLGAFRVFDRNDDGFITAEELQAVLLNLGMPEGKSLVSCKEMIRSVDRNGDGQCDIREFIEMMSAKCF